MATVPLPPGVELGFMGEGGSISEHLPVPFASLGEWQADRTDRAPRAAHGHRQARAPVDATG